MKIIQYPNKYKFKSPTLLLGGFEVFHIGHFLLLEKAREITNGEVIIMLINNVWELPKYHGKIIMSLNPRLQQLANMDIDGVILINIDNAFMHQTGEEFIDKLINNYNIKQMVCGKDFKYGRFASKTSSDLKDYFPNTSIINIKKVNDAKVSSSIIKELIYYGDIEVVNSLLVGNWVTQGLIDDGWKYIHSKNVIKPHAGIYAVSIEYEKFLYYGIMHINIEKDSKLFLVKMNNNLLGRNVYVHWYKRIRVIIKDSEDGVNTNDVNKLKKYLSKI